jgi:hypothetical protein
MPNRPVEVGDDDGDERVVDGWFQEEDGGGVEWNAGVEVMANVVEGAVGDVAVEVVVGGVVGAPAAKEAGVVVVSEGGVTGGDLHV